MTLKLSKSGNLIWTNKKGQWHREKGPAIISHAGLIEFHFNGDLHRLDGPARIWGNGSKTYSIYGYRYSKAEYYMGLKRL